MQQRRSWLGSLNADQSAFAQPQIGLRAATEGGDDELAKLVLSYSLVLISPFIKLFPRQLA